MREDHPLGYAGRPRRVDDRRLVAERDSVGTLAHLFDAHAPPGTRQDTLGTPIKGEDIADPLRAHGLHQLGLLRGRRDDDAHVCVGQDVRDLLGRVRLVDRHGDRTAGQGSHVDEGPLVGGGSQNREVVTRLEADADEATRDGIHFRQEALHRHLAPGTHVRATLDRELAGVTLHALVQHLREVHILGGFSRRNRLP